MNPDQLSTISEALELSSLLGGIGKGVKDIYIPEYGGPFKAPEIGNSKFYHFRFNNGAEGLNVGLVRETLKKDPNTGLQRIALDVSQSAAPVSED